MLSILCDNKIIKKKLFIILILFFNLLPIYNINAETLNAGFIQGNIWYSVNSFEEGDKIKIYTAIFNPNTRELSGTVIFFDNNIVLGKKNFIVEAKSLKDISIDWTVNTGNHSIFGKIENAKFLISTNEYEEAYLTTNETSKSSSTINKKIIVKKSDTSDVNIFINSIADKANAIGENSIKGLENIIEDNTPEYISTKINIATNAIETFREEMGTMSENKQNEIKKEIKILNSNNAQKEKDATNKLEKPLKFTELFALALFSNIFNNKFIFYTLLILFVFLSLYYTIRHLIK